MTQGGVGGGDEAGVSGSGGSKMQLRTTMPHFPQVRLTFASGSSNNNNITTLPYTDLDLSEAEYAEVSACWHGVHAL
jgi:hypothetical protein